MMAYKNDLEELLFGGLLSLGALLRQIIGRISGGKEGRLVNG